MLRLQQLEARNQLRLALPELLAQVEAGLVEMAEPQALARF
jgi:hypothetical protein